MQHPVDVRFAKPASQLTEQEIHAMTKDELQRLLYTSGPYHPVSHRIPAYADRGDLIRMALTPAYGVHAYAARAGDPVFRWGKLRRENIVARHAAAVNELSKRLPLDVAHLIAPPPVDRAGKPLKLQAPKPVVKKFDEGDLLYKREPSGFLRFFRVLGHTAKGTPSLSELHYPGSQHQTPAGASQPDIRMFNPRKMSVGFRVTYDPAMVKWNP